MNLLEVEDFQAQLQKLLNPHPKNLNERPEDKEVQIPGEVRRHLIQVSVTQMELHQDSNNKLKNLIKASVLLSQISSNISITTLTSKNLDKMD
jgi:hypothetical protein